MNFTDAIRSTPEIAECLRNGITGLGRHIVAKISSAYETRDLIGSVDIDTCLEKRYPNAHSLGLCIRLRKIRVYYVEVHQGRQYAVK